MIPIRECPYRSPRAVAEAIRHIIKDKIFCDIGCGEGDFLSFIASYAKHVKGFDVDPDRYKYAIERGFEVIHGDLRTDKLPEADVYYAWLDRGPKQNNFLLNKLMDNPDFNGTLIIAGDSSLRHEATSILRCSQHGRLVEVEYNEGPKHRQHGKMLLAIIRCGLEVTKKVVLTFDDGLKSHINFVAPLLLKNDFGATFFIHTHQGSRLTDIECTNVPDVQQLSDMGFEIGNHFTCHRDLTHTNSDRIRRGLRSSQNRLAEWNITNIVSFCPPAFLYNDEILDIVIKHGFEYVRCGCGRHQTFGFWQKGGSGPPFNEYGNTHEILCSVAGKNYGIEHTKQDILRLKTNETLVLCFHDFSNKPRPIDWTERQFKELVDFLVEVKIDVIPLRMIDQK